MNSKSVPREPTLRAAEKYLREQGEFLAASLIDPSNPSSVFYAAPPPVAEPVASVYRWSDGSRRGVPEPAPDQPAAPSVVPCRASVDVVQTLPVPDDALPFTCCCCRQTHYMAPSTAKATPLRAPMSQGGRVVYDPTAADPAPPSLDANLCARLRYDVPGFHPQGCTEIRCDAAARLQSLLADNRALREEVTREHERFLNQQSFADTWSDDNKYLRETITLALDRAVKAEARVCELEPDAARYRWLRGGGICTIPAQDYWLNVQAHPQAMSLCQTLDARIDAARNAQEK